MTKNNDLLSQMPNKYRKLLYAMYKDQVLGADIIIEIRNDIKAGKREVLQELMDEVERIDDNYSDSNKGLAVGNIKGLIHSKIEECSGKDNK